MSSTEGLRRKVAQDSGIPASLPNKKIVFVIYHCITNSKTTTIL